MNYYLSFLFWINVSGNSHMLLRHILLIIVFPNLLLVTKVNSQQSLFKDVIPPSPDVAALGKYGEVPVGYYTGIPNISIPIYEIRNGDLAVPINLSYHAGGVRVEEVASSVGLSWSLNAGGVIQRSVRGLPDEVGYWYPQPVENRIETIMQSGNTHQLFLDLDAGIRDGEADIYTFNFAGHSGKFVFDQTGVPHLIPQQNLLIGPSGAGWKITDENGFKFYFLKSERTSSAACSLNSDQISTTAWFLTRIENKDATRFINFTYESNSFTYAVRLGETKHFSLIGTACLQDQGPCVGTQNSVTERIKRIDFEEGYVEFNYLTARCDVLEDESLDEIVVYNRNNALIKKFLLTHSYFGNDQDCDIHSAPERRLKLDAVQEVNAIESKPPHVLTYNTEIRLPGRFSTAQDHWGFYNGKVSNHSMISSFSTPTHDGYLTYFPGADRNTDPNFVQAGILTKIRYPTGGETIFTYESNRIEDTRLDPLYREEVFTYSVTNKPIAQVPNPLGVAPLVIPQGGAIIEFANISGLEVPWAGCDIGEVWVTKNGQTYTKLTNSLTGSFSNWPLGSYGLKLITECGVDAVIDFNVVIIARIPIQTTERFVGGLRVRKIQDVPGDGGEPVTREFRYTLENDNARSSGVLVNFPRFEYDLSIRKWEVDEFDQPKGPMVQCAYRVRTSFSNYPLATTMGSYVGYSHVIEDFGMNGENRHTFLAYEDPAPQFPFGFIENFDWRRGFLSNSKTYARINGQLRIVKEVLNTPTEFNEFRVYGVKVGRDFYEIGPQNPQFSVTYSYYPNASSFFNTVKSVERFYDVDNSANYFEKTQETIYSPLHLQPVQSTYNTSKSTGQSVEEVVTFRKYPFDYTFNGTPSGSEALGIKKLKDVHAVNNVVEEYVVKRNRNVSDGVLANEKVIAGSLTTFFSDKPNPNGIYKLEMSSPIPLSTFGSGSSIAGNSFVKSNYYKLKGSYSNYDTKSNIGTTQLSDNFSTSYLWGYGKLQPIAIIQNEPNLNNIAATSFEAESEGNWVYDLARPAPPSSGLAITGRNCFQVSSTKTVRKLNLTTTKNYLLTFWYQTGASITVSGGTQTKINTRPGPDGWNFSSREITATTSITISGTGLIDELRLAPVESQITTYTYDLLKGITSKNDTNNVVSYFEYDLLGRLVLTKDADRNINNSYTYHYKK